MNYTSVIQNLEKQYDTLKNQLTNTTNEDTIITLKEKRVKVYEELSKMRRLQHESQFVMDLNDEY